MAGLSLYCFINPSILLTHPSESSIFVSGSDQWRARKTRGFVVSYAHSNPKIINPKKKSRYGQTLSPYDSDEDEELDDQSDEDDDWLLNDGFAEVTEYEKKKPKSQKQTIAKKGGKKGIVKSWENPEESETDKEDLDIGISRNASEKKNNKEKESWR